MFKALTVGTVFCFTVIVFIKFIWGDTPETWDYGQELGEVLFNLSIGYIAAYIFYLLDFYIPRQVEIKTINKRIESSVLEIQERMEHQFQGIFEKYISTEKGFSDISKTELELNVKRLDLTGDMGYHEYFNERERNKNRAFIIGSMAESLHKDVIGLEVCIKEIFLLPFNMDYELVSLLHGIKKSEYHEEIKNYTLSPSSSGTVVEKATGNTLSHCIYDYYLMMIALRKYMKKNKMS